MSVSVQVSCRRQTVPDKRSEQEQDSTTQGTFEDKAARSIGSI